MKRNHNQYTEGIQCIDTAANIDNISYYYQYKKRDSHVSCVRCLLYRRLFHVVHIKQQDKPVKEVLYCYKCFYQIDKITTICRGGV